MRVCGPILKQILTEGMSSHDNTFAHQDHYPVGPLATRTTTLQDNYSLRPILYLIGSGKLSRYGVALMYSQLCSVHPETKYTIRASQLSLSAPYWMG